MAKANVAKCPECGASVELESDSEAGDLIYCPECDAELTITDIHPPKLKVMEDADETEYEESLDISDFYKNEDSEEGNNYDYL